MSHIINQKIILMLHIIRKAKTIQALAFVALAALLSSFSPKGGEGFEIYLNNKLVLQQYGSELKTVKSLQLDQRNLNDELMIKYHHCGKVGKSRTIILKDGKNKILKQWNFADGTETSNAMTCKVKDILDLQKKNGSITINLFYSSSELPGGRILATIAAKSNATASL
jgi:hypothetical protein